MSEFIRSCLAVCNLCICLRSMRFIIFLRLSSFSTVILWHYNFVCDPSHVSDLFVWLLIAAIILVVGEFNVSSRVVLLLWNILLDMLYLVLWLFWVCTVPSGLCRAGITGAFSPVLWFCEGWVLPVHQQCCFVCPGCCPWCSFWADYWSFCNGWVFKTLGEGQSIA